MKRLLAYLTCSLMLTTGFSQVQKECAEAVTSAGSIALTITHNGLIGNAFSGNYDINGWPSGEYPRNSGIEHVFDGGFWAGARINGATITITPSNPSQAGAGDSVSVTVAVNFNNVTWLPAPIFLGGKGLTATTVMRRETVQ